MGRLGGAVGARGGPEHRGDFEAAAEDYRAAIRLATELGAQVQAGQLWPGWRA
ncbi:hypothetical protein NKH77_15190 [Streptomyces sp. M19]